jgi:glutamate-1-semialdehyde 2,1-aminomutase
LAELAERFVGLVTHADWTTVCKNGSDATSMALVIARAHSGRGKIIMARGTHDRSHTWNTPGKAGIMPEDEANIIYRIYNDPQTLEERGGDLAGVFATAFREAAVVHSCTGASSQTAAGRL